MTDAVEVVREAQATLNLGLRVVGRRPDGFHDLDSLFVRLDLADRVGLFEARGGGTGDRGDDLLARAPAGDPWLDPRPLPLGPDNLVRRALAAYRAAAARCGVPVPRAAATLTKRIPWGAGLAGGSADAAATLEAAAVRWPAAVDVDALALALGSDVPFCASGLRAARVRGRGERLERVVLPRLAFVLVYPAVAVPTGAAFGWWGEDSVDVPAPDPEAYASGALPAPRNALEEAVAARVPAVAAALRALREDPIGPVAMSGSGSTCFALTRDPAAARAKAAAVAERHPAWWVRVAETRSDLTADRVGGEGSPADVAAPGRGA